MPDASSLRQSRNEPCAGEHDPGLVTEASSRPSNPSTAPFPSRTASTASSISTSGRLPTPRSRSEALGTRRPYSSRDTVPDERIYVLRQLDVAQRSGFLSRAMIALPMAI